MRRGGDGGGDRIAADGGSHRAADPHLGGGDGPPLRGPIPREGGQSSRLATP